MQTFEAIEKRRSVKHYSEHTMTEAEINQLLSAAILSPTSFNIQNWRFVVVTDMALRKALRQAAWNQAQVEEASLLIILTANLDAWNEDTERYWANTPEDTQVMMAKMTRDFYQGKTQLQRDEALRSCGIAAQTIMLAAKDMGYDACPMIGFDPDAVAEIINLPKNHLITMMISVGKAAQEVRPRSGQLKLEEVWVKNRF